MTTPVAKRTPTTREHLNTVAMLVAELGKLSDQDLDRLEETWGLVQEADDALTDALNIGRTL